MSYIDKLLGVFIPIATPFINEQVEWDMLCKNVCKYNDTQLKGFMILGGNGEYLGLSEEESLRVIDTVIEYKSPEKTAIVGVGRESAYNTLEFIKKAAHRGAEFASIITPFYYAKFMTENTLTQYYIRIAEESPVPIIVYNSPEYAAGVSLSIHTVSILSRHPNIIAMKNSSNEPIDKYLQQVRKEDEFYIQAGRVSHFIKGLYDGAIGATLSMANFLPGQCCEIYELFVKGEKEKANTLCESLIRINRVVSKSSVPGVKAAMNLLGYDGGEVRLPLITLDQEKQSEIKEVLYEEGLL